MELIGITHKLPTYEWVLFLWRKINCSRNWHLFDEVFDSEYEHYLSCDACNLVIYIDKIDNTYQENIGEYIVSN